ncbi:MAG: IS110 family transposase [Flavobacteriaceae bacterium]|nr:IS110 family transposase [Flavobacteriaceae bacterium]
MELFYYLGIDVSKDTIDVMLRDHKGSLLKGQFKNTKKGMKEMGKQLARCKDFEWNKTLACFEYTGIYVNHLLNFLISKNGNIWFEKPLQIKNSLGMVRGKSDLVDAERIADYAFRYQDRAKLWTPPRPVIEKLKKLSTIRRQFIKMKNQLKKPMEESKIYDDKELYTVEKQMKTSLIKKVEMDIANVDKLIATTMAQDEELSKLASKITSVTGVGKVTAAAIIVTTNEFQDIKEAKKFACYAGIAPYPNSSGSSKKGREKVSHLANKKVKTLLHLCALSAIGSKGELKLYYEKKVEQGKNKMAAINAVRNKIVHRVFAVVRDNRKYEKNYHYSLV